MTNSFCTKQNRVVQIHVGFSAIPSGLASMKDKRYVDAKLLLSFSEFQQGVNIVDEGFKAIFMSNKVETYVEGLLWVLVVMAGIKNRRFTYLQLDAGILALAVYSPPCTIRVLRE